MSLKLVGTSDTTKRQPRPLGHVLAELKVVGGSGVWRSLQDYQETVEQAVDGLPGTWNAVFAALCGVRNKFGTGVANGVIEAYELEAQGFSRFEAKL